MHAVQRGDETRPRGRVHLAPGQPDDPGGHARAYVDDIGLFLRQPASKLGHLQESQQRLLAQLPLHMTAAFMLQLLDQAATGRHHDRFVPGGHQPPCDLQRPTLDAAQFQRR
eukprot:Anaeramoba_flamelloidesa1060664_7.p1 GENE.a1060664_7~~a1060664_7.p1  ORF type:complete len:112 (-),score=5.86 a1060664_7:111-446(-)